MPFHGVRVSDERLRFVVLASAGGTGMDELRAIGLLADAYLAASATYSDMTWRERRQRMPWTDR